MKQSDLLTLAITVLLAVGLAFFYLSGTFDFLNVREHFDTYNMPLIQDSPEKMYYDQQVNAGLGNCPSGNSGCIYGMTSSDVSALGKDGSSTGSSTGTTGTTGTTGSARGTTGSSRGTTGSSTGTTGGSSANPYSSSFYQSEASCEPNDLTPVDVSCLKAKLHSMYAPGSSPTIAAGSASASAFASASAPTFASSSPSPVTSMPGLTNMATSASSVDPSVQVVLESQSYKTNIESLQGTSSTIPGQSALATSAASVSSAFGQLGQSFSSSLQSWAMASESPYAESNMFAPTSVQSDDLATSFNQDSFEDF